MTTFLVIGLVGLALLSVALLLGDLLDGLLDALTGDVFSAAVIGAFVAALGFGGATAEGLGAPTPLSWMVGAAAGVGFGWFAAWLTRLVKGGGSDDTPTTAGTLGRDADVISAIPSDGFGVVRVLVGGHSLQLNARAEEPIAPGTPVHVTGVLSPTAVTVAPNWPSLD